MDPNPGDLSVAEFRLVAATLLAILVGVPLLAVLAAAWADARARRRRRQPADPDPEPEPEPVPETPP